MFRDKVKKFIDVLTLLDISKLNTALILILETKKSYGRVFLLGNGGSAGVASHLVNDFRRLSSIEAYSPWDNPEEISSLINDGSWESSLVESLKISKLSSKDLLFFISASGGFYKSKNLLSAALFGKSMGAKILSIVGPDGEALEGISSLTIKLPNLPDVSTNVECLALLIGHWIINEERLQA